MIKRFQFARDISGVDGENKQVVFLPSNKVVFGILLIFRCGHKPKQLNVISLFKLIEIHLLQRSPSIQLIRWHLPFISLIIGDSFIIEILDGMVVFIKRYGQGFELLDSSADS